MRAAGRGRRGRSIPDNDRAIAGEAHALLGRTARRTLDVGDLGPADVVLPCQDSAAGPRLRAALAAAVLAQPAAWANADDLSPLVSALLIERRGELADVRVQRFGGNAEDRARGALLSGDAGRMERATRLCKLKQELGVEVKTNSSCGRLLEGPPPGRSVSRRRPRHGCDVGPNPTLVPGPVRSHHRIPLMPKEDPTASAFARRGASFRVTQQRHGS